MLNEFEFGAGDSFASDFSFDFTTDLTFDPDPVIEVTPGEIDVIFPQIIDVIEANAAPTPLDDSANAEVGTPVSIAVLDNDTDAEGNPLFVLSATQSENGSTTVNADGTVAYTANAGFVGIDSFTYTVFDGFHFADAIVTVTVTDPNLLIVDTLSDVIDANDGFTSLREALILANETEGADNIEIGIEGTLEVNEVFSVEGDVSIAGNGAVLDADGDNRIFEIDGGVTLALDDLTLTGGDAKKQGGAILGGDNVTLAFTDVTLTDNEAKKEGGAINLGDNATITMDGGAVSGNSSKKDGGAIFVGDSARIEITGTELSDNSTKKDGGVISAGDDAFVFIDNAVIENNSVTKNGGVLALGRDAEVFISTPSDPFEGTNSARKLGDFLIAEDDLLADVNGEMFAGDDLFF